MFHRVQILYIYMASFQSENFYYIKIEGKLKDKKKKH